MSDWLWTSLAAAIVVFVLVIARRLLPMADERGWDGRDE